MGGGAARTRQMFTGKYATSSAKDCERVEEGETGRSPGKVMGSSQKGKRQAVRKEGVSAMWEWSQRRVYEKCWGEGLWNDRGEDKKE